MRTRAKIINVKRGSMDFLTCNTMKTWKMRIQVGFQYQSPPGVSRVTFLVFQTRPGSKMSG